MDDEAASTLGERLLSAVTNLWNSVNSNTKVLDHHGQEIEALKARMRSLERKVHGLKSTKGKAIAQNARLRATITDAESKLDKIGSILN
jgi:cell division protein FtsB